MKKLLLLFLLVAGGVSTASARWVGNSAVYANGTWYYCANDLGDLTDNGFNELNLGTINYLILGGQSEVYTGSEWNGGTMTMYYKIDNGDAHAITLTKFAYNNNNNVLRTGGSTFTSACIDLSGLTAGNHSIGVWFYSGSGDDEAYDSRDSKNYVATFTIPSTPSVTVTAAGYATYVSSYDLDFTSTAIKAYTADVNESTGQVVLASINKVPALTPVVLYKAGGATESIPLATSKDTPGTNDLVAGTGAAVATGTSPYNYILNNVDDIIGFYKAAGNTVAPNRAYLQTTYNVAAGSSSRMSIVFADETTGINNLTPALYDGAVYDLQGRRVAQPTKGLYIINGKKVIR